MNQCSNVFLGYQTFETQKSTCIKPTGENVTVTLRQQWVHLLQKGNVRLANLQVYIFLLLPHSCSVYRRVGVKSKAELWWHIAAESGRKLTSQFPCDQHGQHQQHQPDWHHQPHQEITFTLPGTRLFVRNHMSSQSIKDEFRKNTHLKTSCVNLQRPRHWWTQLSTNLPTENLRVQGDSCQSISA